VFPLTTFVERGIRGKGMYYSFLNYFYFPSPLIPLPQGERESQTFPPFMGGIRGRVIHFVKF
jgi:hypothetical protein